MNSYKTSAIKEDNAPARAAYKEMAVEEKLNLEQCYGCFQQQEEQEEKD